MVGAQWLNLQKLLIHLMLKILRLDLFSLIKHISPTFVLVVTKIFLKVLGILLQSQDQLPISAGIGIEVVGIIEKKDTNRF